MFFITLTRTPMVLPGQQEGYLFVWASIQGTDRPSVKQDTFLVANPAEEMVVYIYYTLGG